MAVSRHGPTVQKSTVANTALLVISPSQRLALSASGVDGGRRGRNKVSSVALPARIHDI